MFNTKQYLVKEAVSCKVSWGLEEIEHRDRDTAKGCRKLFSIQSFAKQTAITLFSTGLRHEQSQCGKDYGERRAGRDFQIFSGVQEDAYLQHTLTPHSVPSPRA